MFRAGRPERRAGRPPYPKFLACDDEPYRPAAEFWAAYDAQQPAG